MSEPKALTYSEHAYQLWVKRLAEAEGEVERYEARLSRVLGRLLAARKRARAYRRKLAQAEESVARDPKAAPIPEPEECERCGGSFTDPCEECIRAAGEGDPTESPPECA